MRYLADRVMEIASTSGTGTFSLSGAVTGFRTFVAKYGTGVLVEYVAESSDRSEWEHGIGTLTDATPDTLTRTTILDGSNGTSAVNFTNPPTIFGTVGAGVLAPLTSHWPESPPLVPTSYDDEFIEASLNARWTETASPGAGTTTYNKFGTYLCLEMPGHATLQQLIVRQAIGAEGDAGTAFQVTARLGLGAYAATAISDIAIGDNTTFAAGNYVLGTLKNVSGDYNFEVYDGASQYDQVVGKAQGFLWVHMQRSSGNVLRIFISGDGIHWMRVYSGSKTFNIDYLFIRLRGATSTTQSSMHTCDWIRVNDARFTQQVS